MKTWLKLADFALDILDRLFYWIGTGFLTLSVKCQDANAIVAEKIAAAQAKAESA
jgi:hypothetical protein